MQKHALLLTGILAITGLMTACNQTKTETATSATVPATEIYEIHKDNRIYVFYDRDLYNAFLSVGETAFRLTRIGEGPNGETIVFGLTKADKKKGADIPTVQLFEKKTTVEGEFYGELRNHGRIYVFNQFEDMTPVRQFGHPNFFYTEIASGPKGETVVYVLNKDTKKHKPEALIEKFKSKQL